MFRVRLFSVLAVCAAGLVSTSTASAQSKIAVVNWQKALLDTQEFKKIVADLTAKYKPRQDALEKAQRDLVDIQTQLQSSQGKLSAVGQADLEAQGQRKQREVDRLSMDLQDDTEKDRNEMVQHVGSRMTEVVKKLLDEKGYDAVFDTASTVAFKSGVEITNDAIAAYDKAYPAKP
jgi:outer membrane protein